MGNKTIRQQPNLIHVQLDLSANNIHKTTILTQGDPGKNAKYSN